MVWYMKLSVSSVDEASAGCKLARATTSWPFARQWRREKKESLPPDIRATILRLLIVGWSEVGRGVV